MAGDVTLLDERAGTLRVTIGHLLETSRHVDLALTRVRLAALDLTREEVVGPSRCRVLLGRLDASSLLDMGPGGGAPPERAAAMARLARWLEGERLEVRSAGIGSWTPDFSIYTRGDGTSTCLLGAHYFGSPQLTIGPSFTASTEDERAAGTLRERFETLWHGSHDVSPAILDVLKRAAGGAGGPGGVHGPEGADGMGGLG